MLNGNTQYCFNAQCVPGTLSILSLPLSTKLWSWLQCPQVSLRLREVLWLLQGHMANSWQKKKNWIKDFRCKKQMLFPPKLIHSSSGLFSITWEPLASWNKGEGSGEALEELRWIYLPQPHSIEQKHHHRSLIIIWLQYLINIIIT